MFRSAFVMVLAAACVFLSGYGTTVSAQDRVPSSERQYSGSDASAEAYRRAESKRRAEFGQHVGTIEYLRWLNGRGYWGASPLPIDRAAYYGYGGRPRNRVAVGVFEPWPYLPGDIWGFSYSPVVAAPKAKPAAESVPTPAPVRRGPVSY